MPADSQTISAVAAAGEVFREYGGERVAREVIGRGGDLLEFYRALQPNVGDVLGIDRAAGLSLTEADVREYSLSRLVMTQLQNRAAHARQLPDPFDRNAELERQVIANDRRASSFETQAAGHRMPWSVLLRDFNVAQVPIGTNLGTQYTPDALRASLPLAALGATVIVLPARSGSFKVPAVTGDLATVAFLGETEAASEGQPSTGMVDLAPRRVGAYVEVSRVALAQGGRELDRILARVIFAKVRSVLEDRSINGDGTGGTPVGVRNTAGVGSVVGGTNGLALTWSHLADLVHAPAASNVDERASGFLVNPTTRKYLVKTQRAAGLPFIWDGGAYPLQGHRAAVSTLIPSTLTKGASSGICSSVVYGADWSNLVIAVYGAPELTVDPFTKYSEGQVRLVIDAYIGVGVLHASAFAKMDDALTP
jgi:hypothetical protein